VAVVPIEGVISGGALGGGEMDLVEAVRQQLRRAERDAAVKAVVLRVDSPGGEVVASDSISKLIDEFQERTGKPVVAAMESVAASGGYYVSVPCRWIVANELTLTGSIGVIMHGYNYRGLMNKVGVRPEVYKSGRFKDMLSPDREDAEISEEERVMLRNLIQETFARFKKVVGEGRAKANQTNKGEGRTLGKNWEEYADGRVFSGRQAYEWGFVDETGDLRTAVRRAKKLAGIDEASVVRYQMPFEFGSFLRLFGRSEGRALKVDFGIDWPPIQAGRLYFMFVPVRQ
jgi:protease-4